MLHAAHRGRPDVSPGMRMTGMRMMRSVSRLESSYQGRIVEKLRILLLLLLLLLDLLLHELLLLLM